MSGIGHGRGFVGWVGGIIAAVISGVLVVVLTAQEPEAGPLRPDDCCDRGIDFAITDQLGEGQITERIVVFVDGRSVGTLVVDVVHANSSLTVTVPEAGTYSYRLEGSIVLDDGYGGSVSLTGVGSGTIKVSNGRAFALAADYSSDPVRLILQ